jgi:hypothetical protein
MGRNAPDWGARLLGMMNEDLSVRKFFVSGGNERKFMKAGARGAG